MKTFKEIEEARARSQRILSRENTYTKVDEVCERAVHPQLGKVTVLSTWKNSVGAELSRVKFSASIHYVNRDVLTRLRGQSTRARRRALREQQPRIKYSKSRGLTAHLAV